MSSSVFGKVDFRLFPPLAVRLFALMLTSVTLKDFTSGAKSQRGHFYVFLDLSALINLITNELYALKSLSHELPKAKHILRIDLSKSFELSGHS